MLYTTDFIIKRIIGEFQPAGDSRIDEERAENLDLAVDLVVDLVSKINDIAKHCPSRNESPVRRIGVAARDCIDRIKEELE